jgi:cation transport ATPase
MQDEILKHLITILVSIVASVTTTILIYYIKSKRMKVVEKLTSYDERREIIKSVVNNSLYSFALATFITTLELDYYIKLSFIILFCFMTLIFTYSHLRFHSSYFVDALRNRKTRYWLIIISLTSFESFIRSLFFTTSICSLFSFFLSIAIIG